MASHKKNNLIGFDPLAWMKEPGVESGAAGVESIAQVGAEPSIPDRHAAPGTRNAEPGTPHGPGAITLGEALTIEQVAMTKEELGRHLNDGSLTLEAGGLERIDAAGLQLLAAFVRTADGRGVQVAWRSCSPALRDAARRAGLASVLHLS